MGPRPAPQQMITEDLWKRRETADRESGSPGRRLLVWREVLGVLADPSLELGGAELWEAHAVGRYADEHPGAARAFLLWDAVAEAIAERTAANLGPDELGRQLAVCRNFLAR